MGVTLFQLSHRCRAYSGTKDLNLPETLRLIALILCLLGLTDRLEIPEQGPGSLCLPRTQSTSRSRYPPFTEAVHDSKAQYMLIIPSWSSKPIYRVLVVTCLTATCQSYTSPQSSTSYLLQRGLFFVLIYDNIAAFTFTSLPRVTRGCTTLRLNLLLRPQSVC